MLICMYTNTYGVARKVDFDMTLGDPERYGRNISRRCMYEQATILVSIIESNYFYSRPVVTVFLKRLGATNYLSTEGGIALQLG